MDSICRVYARCAPVHDDVADDPDLPECEPVGEEAFRATGVEVVLIVLGQCRGRDRAWGARRLHVGYTPVTRRLHAGYTPVR